MIAFRRRYGASALHLLVMIASFALAGYAAWSLIQDRTIMVVVWFVGAAVGHDVILFPLYSIIDRRFGGRRRRDDDVPAAAGAPAAPWLNYVRVPAAISGLLLLVFLPSIARLSSIYTSTTALSSGGYLARWLGITGALFLVSAVAYAFRLRRARA
jgi:hypothetical protein